MIPLSNRFQCIRRRVFPRMALAAVLTLMTATTSCHAPQSGAGAANRVHGEPVIRVRIINGAETLRLDGPATLRFAVFSENSGVGQHHRIFTAPMTVRIAQGRFILQPSGRAALTWTAPALIVEPTDVTTLRIDGHVYPGRVALHPHQNGEPNTLANQLDAVNHLPMEQYLPGVLERELFASWELDAYKAQAVAARTYALYQVQRRRQRHYDLESTTASQAYIGAATRSQALVAAQQTRGLVLTWRDQVFSAYYSSCSGGAGQDASVVFPNGQDIAPLKGRAHGDWGAASPNFSWGPIRRSKSDLTRRLAAWSKQHRHAAVRLRGLAHIAVAKRTHTGRPAQFTVTDVDGKTYLFSPESFRFACNFDGAGPPKLASAQQLKSSFVQMTFSGDEVVFTGRGYGHGVGLCQYGAQAMAQRGYNPASILAFYYPNSRVHRAY